MGKWGRQMGQDFKNLPLFYLFLKKQVENALHKNKEVKQRKKL